MSSSSTPAQASSSTPSSSSTPKPEDKELEKLLSREASAFQRELEVERILKAFKLNPYDILDIDESATQDDVKRKYRQLSLFIHPDKTPHERAPEAFDLLKKAESELSDKAKREELDAVITQARVTLLKSLSLPASTRDDDPQLKAISNPPFKVRFRAQAKELLIDEEVRRRKAIKMHLANEGLEARKKDEEIASKKRKAEEDRQWEDNRDQRVDSWRSFSNTKKKKKNKSAPLLG